MVTLSKVHAIPLTDSYLIDFRIPEVQDILVQQTISVAQCGLYDGIFNSTRGGLTREWRFLVDRSRGRDRERQYYSTLEEELEARLSILSHVSVPTSPMIFS